MLKLILGLCLMCGVAPVWAQLAPASVAQAVVAEHVHNFYQVDAAVYRAAQPDHAAFAELQQRGVRSVLNLRAFHGDSDPAQGTKLTLLAEPLHSAFIHYTQLVDAVALIETAPKPVLVHCWNGSDRTGAVIAAYRVADDGWLPEQAVDELVHGGFGYHAVFANIPSLIRRLDAAQFRRDVAQRVLQRQQTQEH